MTGGSNHMTSVLIIVENLPLPFDRRVWQEARTLRDAGYHVSAICPKQGVFTAGRESIEGIEIYRHTLREGSDPLSYLFEYAWALVAQMVLALRIYCRTRFRVIQACNPPDTIFVVAAFFKIFGVRFIFDHHDLNPELFEVKYGSRGVLYRLVCLAEWLTFRTADVSIATNASYRQVAIERGRMAAERVFVVHSSPNLRDIRPTPPRVELKRGRRFLVLYLGMMGPQDGVDLFLEAATRVAATRNDTSFVLVGDGPEVPRLRAQATAKGLDGVLQFAGVRVGKDLAEYLSTADVGVAPDPKNPMNDKSTMNKVLEYMSYGRPLVLFDLTEGRRAAGDAALYAQPNDPADLADRILQLLNSEALRRELGERGRQRVKERFNWELEAKVLLEAYEAALA
jgi:glycosyltransferase involved in cell wall biosynthesis